MEDIDTVEVVFGPGLSLKIRGEMDSSQHTDPSCNSLAFRAGRSGTVSLVFERTEEVAEDEYITHVEQAVIYSKKYNIDNSKLLYDLIEKINREEIHDKG